MNTGDSGGMRDGDRDAARVPRRTPLVCPTLDLAGDFELWIARIRELCVGLKSRLMFDLSPGPQPPARLMRTTASCSIQQQHACGGPTGRSTCTYQAIRIIAIYMCEYMYYRTSVPYQTIPCLLGDHLPYQTIRCLVGL